MPRLCRRRLLHYALALPLFGCGNVGHHHHPLRLGSNLWLGYETLYLARAQGRLDEHQVQLVEMPNTTDVMRALRGGVLEAACLTLDELLTLLAEGVPLRVVLVLDASHGADAVYARPEVGGLVDLWGRRIAVEHSAVGNLMLHALLEEAQLEVDDVELLPSTPERHLLDYAEGRADVVVTYEPMASQLAALGAQRLFDSSQRPGMILDVLAVHQEAIRPHATGLNTLIQAHLASLDLLHRRPEQALPVIARRQRLSESQVARAYEGIQLQGRVQNQHWLQGELLGTLHTLAQRMREQGLLTSSVRLDGVLEPRFILGA